MVKFVKEKAKKVKDWAYTTTLLGTIDKEAQTKASLFWFYAGDESAFFEK